MFLKSLLFATISIAIVLKTVSFFSSKGSRQLRGIGPALGAFAVAGAGFLGWLFCVGKGFSRFGVKGLRV